MPCFSIARLIGAVALALAAVAPATAQDVASFYRGKTIDMYIGYTVGGGYDIYGRMVARFLGKHLPGNPNVVPRNMEGAGSIRLANYLYTVAPKDGTALGIIGRGVPFDPILGRPGSQFEAAKFTWVGSANDEVSVCVAWHTSGVTKFEELKTREITVGAAGAGSDDDQFPRIINGTLGTKMKVISAYPGGAEIAIALEREEVAGRCSWSWSSIKSNWPHWYRDKKINVLAQLALGKHADLPDVPLVMDFATTNEQRQILQLVFARQGLGRPFLAPPDVPADRAAALRKAFMDTMNDPEFLAAAEKSKIEIRPLSGEQVEALVRRVYSETKPEVAAKAAAMLK